VVHRALLETSVSVGVVLVHFEKMLDVMVLGEVGER
jgi:hypothetical protein